MDFVVDINTGNLVIFYQYPSAVKLSQINLQNRQPDSEEDIMSGEESDGMVLAFS